MDYMVHDARNGKKHCKTGFKALWQMMSCFFSIIIDCLDMVRPAFRSSGTLDLGTAVSVLARKLLQKLKRPQYSSGNTTGVF
jgi:hypothetical protein